MSAIAAERPEDLNQIAEAAETFYRPAVLGRHQARVRVRHANITVGPNDILVSTS